MVAPARRGDQSLDEPQPVLVAVRRKAVMHAGHWRIVVAVNGTRDECVGAARSAPARLPLIKQWQFAVGQFGAAALVGLVGVQLVSFYLPPVDSETGKAVLPIVYVSQHAIYGVFNVVSITAAVRASPEAPPTRPARPPRSHTRRPGHRHPHAQGGGVLGQCGDDAPLSGTPAARSGVPTVGRDHRPSRGQYL